MIFFFNETATAEIYTHYTTLSLHYALPIWWRNKSDTVAGQGIGFTPATNPATGTSNSRFFNTPGLADYIANNFPTRAGQADWAPEAARSADIGTGLGLDGPLAEDNRFWGLKLRWDQDLGETMKLVSDRKSTRLNSSQ